MTYNRVNIAFYLTKNYNTHIKVFASNAKEINIMILFFLTRNFLLFINNITNIIAHHTDIIFYQM